MSLLNGTIEEPTLNLRWLERVDGRVLQQCWDVKTYMDGLRVGAHVEWRDIPIETEQT